MTQNDRLTANADTVCVYIGVGSNLSDPIQQVKTAFQTLSQSTGLSAVTLSPLYESKAIGPGDQPNYINAVIQANYKLTPIELLLLLQSIENNQGRVRLERWGPRTLDLDLLLYGNQVITSDSLLVPHPRLAQRNFVIAPLMDLAPNLVLPNGVSIASLLASLGNEGLTKLPPSP